MDANFSRSNFQASEGYYCQAYDPKNTPNSPIACLFEALPFVLENIKFGYITLVLLAPILVVSIFGTIKESYRWFILNQVFWDIFLIYDAICDVPKGPDQKLQPSCFYSSWRFSEFMPARMANAFFNNIVFVSMYAPLFLLTVSRFVAMYFSHFYARISDAKTVLTIIGIFQLAFMIFVNIYDWTNVINNTDLMDSKRKCESLGPVLSTQCKAAVEANIPLWLIIIERIKFLIPPVAILIADILAILVIAKVASQFHYQAKHNRSSLGSSVKIATVILCQCIFLSLLCCVFTYAPYINTFAQAFGFDQNAWPYFLARENTLQWLSVLRIFVDSLVLLVVLTEYRKNITKFGLFLIGRKSKMPSPSQTKTLFNRRTTVTVISLTEKKASLRKMTI